MTFETGNRRLETGKLKQETRKPGRAKREPYLMAHGGGCRRSVPPESGVRSPFPGLERPPVSGIRGTVSGLELFAGIPYRAIRGRLGDCVYKTYGDKVIVTRVPSFDGYVPTGAQRERREKLRAATAYAQAVYAHPAAKAIYVTAAEKLGRQPFRLAVADFLRGRPRVKLGPTAKPPAIASERKRAAQTRRMPAQSLRRFLLQRLRANRLPPPADLRRSRVPIHLHARAAILAGSAWNALSRNNSGARELRESTRMKMGRRNETLSVHQSVTRQRISVLARLCSVFRVHSRDSRESSA
jgi:hypothetical protein